MALSQPLHLLRWLLLGHCLPSLGGVHPKLNPMPPAIFVGIFQLLDDMKTQGNYHPIFSLTSSYVQRMFILIFFNHQVSLGQFFWTFGGSTKTTGDLGLSDLLSGSCGCSEMFHHKRLDIALLESLDVLFVVKIDVDWCDMTLYLKCHEKQHLKNKSR